MVCNQYVPDPNKHEQTPDVMGERPWRLSGSWEHIADRRERRRHSHAFVCLFVCLIVCLFVCLFVGLFFGVKSEHPSWARSTPREYINSDSVTLPAVLLIRFCFFWFLIHTASETTDEKHTVFCFF